MGRAMILITGVASRAKAASWLSKAPKFTRITFQGPQRTTPQNDRMWVLLTFIAEQLSWDGQKHSTDDWKDYFMGLLNRDKTMTAEEGPPIAVGRSTSNLSTDEHGLLTEIIVAFADRQGVVIDPEADE